MQPKPVPSPVAKCRGSQPIQEDTIDRHSIMLIANRAKGIANLLAAGQTDQAHFYLSQLTLKIHPNARTAIANHLEIIETAALTGDTNIINIEADKLLALA